MTRASDLFERPNTKRRLIAENCEKGYTKRQTFTYFEFWVREQKKPFIFSNNVGSRRVAIEDIEVQLQKLRDEIGRVYKLMGRADSADFDSEEIATDSDDIEEEEIEEMQEEEEDSDSGKPRAKGKKSVRDEITYFVRRVREIRNFCERRAELSEPLDSIGMRPVETAAKLIPAGIPADALLAAMVLHWPKDAKSDAGISDFDFVKLSRQICEEKGIEPDGKHELFGYVLTLAEERIPIFLVGPMGTGKSYLAKQIADHLELPYGETALSEGATRGDMLGRLTASPDRPFILSKFCEVYAGGGVFNFEEIDAALPEVLITLNNCLAGDKLFNSSNGEEYEKHADFIAMATGNTFGTGATREYTARNKLDAATLDRFRMGRVFVKLDTAIEEKIAYSRLS